MFPKVDPKQSFPELEEEILKFWKKENIFEESIETRSKDNPYRFYDWPPFITGTPHYWSLLSSICKDVVPRYWTMQGKRCERVWGWDCHWLPIEEKVQKKLWLESNKDIEKVWVEKFIQECYSYTKNTSAEWEWYVDHIWRWVDFKNSYKTMDQDYMESVIWVFKKLWEKWLVYKGQRVSLYSWKLWTPISNFEVAMDDSYEEVSDPAITVMFPIIWKSEEEENETSPLAPLLRGEELGWGLPENRWINPWDYLIAWTTTPWTIPAHMALAVNKDLEYSKVFCDWKYYILATQRIESVFKWKNYELIDSFMWEKLVWLKYLPPFDYYYKNEKLKNDEESKNFLVYHAEFVTDKDWTWIAHEAPEFWDVDFLLAKEKWVHISNAIDNEWKYTEEIEDYQWIHYKEANEIIPEKLKELWLLFKKESINHRVAMCPRSWTPLIYKVQDSWFVDIQKLKEKLIKENEGISWYPEHLKHWQFLKSMQGAPDWCISRTRYWWTPMPIWMGYDEKWNEKDMKVFWSKNEIFKASKKSGIINKFLLIRHREAIKNVERVEDWSWDERLNKLTDNWEKQAFDLCKELLEKEDIDVIISSPLGRCKDTMKPYLEKTKKEIIFDDRLKETNPWILDGKPYKVINTTHWDKPFEKWAETGEEVYERVKNLVEEINKKYKWKTIALVSHWYPIIWLNKVFSDFDHKNEDEIEKVFPGQEWYQNVYVFTDNSKAINLHKPYVDDIVWKENGLTYKRIPEVLDVWMDSWSMPYAGVHYPFKMKDQTEYQSEEKERSQARGQSEEEKNQVRDQARGQDPLSNVNCSYKLESSSLFNSKKKLTFFVTTVTHNSRISERIKGKKIKIWEPLVLDDKQQYELTKIFFNIKFEKDIHISQYIINKDRIHFIIHVDSEEELTNSVKTLKSLSTKKFKEFLWVENQEHFSLWAQKFNRKQIKDEKSYKDISEYIINNRKKHGESSKEFEQKLRKLIDKGSWPLEQPWPLEQSKSFNNNNNIELKGLTYPADFIVEYIWQVRAWFYVMHVVWVALFDKRSFTNVITTWIVNGSDWRKMSKSYWNYPDPKWTIQKYWADAIRFYMINSPLMHWANMSFKEQWVQEVVKKVILPLWNTYSFFTTYANIDKFEPKKWNIYYCRHWETENNEKMIMNWWDAESELTQKGIKQAKKAWEKFKLTWVKLDKIISSPKKRAIDTAELIKKQLGYEVEIEVNENLNEQLSWEFLWLSLDEIAKKLWIDIRDKYLLRKRYKDKKYNKIEDISDFDEKVAKEFEKIKNTYKDKNILIVSHSGTFRPINRVLSWLSIKEAHYICHSSPNSKIIKLPNEKRENLLDKWVISETNKLIKDVEKAMESYKLNEATRPIAKFMDKLTNWYIRRSRKRFWKSENDIDKIQAYETLHEVLVELTKVIAPFMPFISEHIYKNLTGNKSLHLDSFPNPVDSFILENLNQDMDMCQKIINLWLAWRQNHSIRVRQPLSNISIWEKLDDYYIEIIKEELNVKEVIILEPSKIAKKICKPNGRIIWPKFGKDVKFIIQEAKAGRFMEIDENSVKVWDFVLEWEEFEIAFEPWETEYEIESWFGMVIAMDWNITKDLKQEWYARDIVRYIQEARKEALYEVSDRISIELNTSEEDLKKAIKNFWDYIEKETLSKIKNNLENPDLEKKFEIDNNKFGIKIKIDNK